jgi:hypothetical protein
MEREKNRTLEERKGAAPESQNPLNAGPPMSISEQEVFWELASVVTDFS